MATTGHAQDFKDVCGDRAVGRRTIPIAYPHIARITVLVGTCSWSLILASVWSLHPWITAAFTSLALLVGYRFLIFNTTADDQVSFYWYNVRCPFVYFAWRSTSLISSATDIDMAFYSACTSKILPAHHEWVEYSSSTCGLGLLWVCNILTPHMQ